MPNGSSYLSLRCVLEYLEANKRIHITARSSVLQKFEKSIPLHLDYLCLSSIGIQTNNISHDAYSLPEVRFTTTRGMREQREIPKRIDDAIKVLHFHYLDGRENIYAKELQLLIPRWGSVVFPANFQLKIRKMKTGDFPFCGEYMSLVDPSSLPLMELKTFPKDINVLNLDVMKSARKLVIPNMGQYLEAWFIPNLPNLANTEIVIQEMSEHYDEAKYLVIIQNYLMAPRNVGACLTFGPLNNRTFKRLLIAVKEKLNGTRVDIKKNVNELTPQTPYAIPVDSTSAALIYGITDLKFGGTNVEIEIVPIDAFTPVDQI